MRTSIFLGVLALALVSTAANADEASRLVPDSAATLRIVQRNGESFVVEVTNATDQPTTFNQVGLYFVPLSPPDDSPQRLGVVAGNEAAPIAPHESRRFTLAAYCIDEHRAAPDAGTHYALAGRRIPSALTSALAGAAKSTSDPQRAIWRVRTQMPTPLVGDARRDSGSTNVADARQRARVVD